MTVAMALTLASSTVPLFGETYEWTDANGGIHFTDNRESVPKKFKGTMRVRDSVRGVEGDNATPPPLAQPPQLPAGEELYGGKPYDWWRARYVELNGQRERATAQLAELRTKNAAAKRKKLILQRASDRASVREAEANLAEQEARIKQIDASIEELSTEAQKARVPASWNE